MSVGRIAASPRRKNRWKSSPKLRRRAGGPGVCGACEVREAAVGSAEVTPDDDGDRGDGVAGEFVASGSTSHRCLYRNTHRDTDLRRKRRAPKGRGVVLHRKR